MIPFSPFVPDLPSARMLQHLFEAHHNGSLGVPRSSADRFREQDSLQERFKSWNLIKDGRLDLDRGEEFDYTLSGHVAFENFQRMNWEYPKEHRDPYDQDAFGLLGEEKKRELYAQVCANRVKYRTRLLKEYKAVFDISDLPKELLGATGTVLADVRKRFQCIEYNPCTTTPSNESNQRNGGGLWDQLTEKQLQTCQRLKGVLAELVEIACISHAVAEAFDEGDPPGSICKHASRALTPFLPLCSDSQLRSLVRLLGAWDDGE